MGRWAGWRVCTAAAVALAVLVAGGPLADAPGTARADAAADRVGGVLRQAKPAKVVKLKVGKGRTTGARARVTVSWRKSRGATSYQVFVGRKRAMKGARAVPARTARRTIGNLKTAKRYCFRVRAVRGKGKRARHGAFSRVVCKRTPRRVGRSRPVWIVAQRIEKTSAGPRAALTLRWPRTRGARSYDLHVGPKYGVQQTRARAVMHGFRSTGRRQETHVVRGLEPGQRYCFQVRGRSRTGVGRLATAHCKIVLPASKALRPTPFALKMATYNICGNAAPCQRRWSWAVRRPHVARTVRMSGAHVVALQETRKTLAHVVADLKPHGYVKACSASGAQALLVRSSVYSVVAGSAGGVRFRADPSHGGCWAKLRHKPTGTLVAVASVHLMKGRAPSRTRARDAQAAEVVSRMEQKYGAVGAATSPSFVIGGDFNSHRNHSYDGPRVRLSAFGFLDAYDISETYHAPNRNSANQYRRTPLKSTTWGSHVDRIFVPPEATVTGWRTVAQMRGGRYVAPIPSDHNPVAMTIYLPAARSTGGTTGGGGGLLGGGGCLLGIFC